MHIGVGHYAAHSDRFVPWSVVPQRIENTPESFPAIIYEH